MDTSLISKINPDDNNMDVLSAKELANQAMYLILSYGIYKYPNQRQKVLDCADIMKRMINEGILYDNENGRFVWDGKYNYSIQSLYQLSSEEQKELLYQAENIFYQILFMAKDNLKHNNGADENTYKTLVEEIVNELTKISRDKTNELLM